MTQADLCFHHDIDNDNKIHTVQHITKDVLEQAKAVPFWSQEYTQLDKGPFTGSVISVANSGVQVFKEAMNRSVDEIARAPRDSYVIGLPTIVEGEGFWGGARLHKNSLITLDKNTELLFRTSQSSEINVAVFSRQRLESYAFNVERMDLSEIMKDVNPVEALPTNIRHKLHAALFIGIEHISKYDDQRNIQNIWRHYEDNLLNASFQALMHAHENTGRQSNHRIHRHIVNCVRDLTLAKNSEPWTIGELCSTLHISRRTLNHAFKQVLGITPVTYMRHVRLHKVRAEIQSAPDQVMSIANIASKWGFWHMSLFSRYYRELFGECPSDTLEQARTA